MHTLRNFHRISKFIALLSLLPALWLLMQGYHGLTGDAQLYAFQALARINPPLATDLYLQNTSQDQFTVFSPLYAFFIRWFGIEGSARLLTVVFTIWFFIAALSLARALIERNTALLAVAFLMIVPSDYGASRVFQFIEGFLTARLPAEALVITAIACHFRGRPRLAVVIGGVALLVHPLMALPGVFLLISFWVSTRVSVMVAVVGVVLIFGIATAAGYLSAMSHLFVVMDDAWLAVVRERSQFLFLQTWTPQDWDLNMRPVLYAAIIAVVSKDDRVRNLCMNAALIGVAGLAVAFIADFSPPLAYLVQGQSWRWIWVVGFVGILLLPSTAMSIWGDEKCGPFCSILLVCGWTLTDSAAPVALCLAIWLSRPYLGRRASLVVRSMAGIASVAILGWFVSKSVPILASHAPAAEQLRRIFALKLPALLLLIGFWRLVRSDGIVWGPALAGTLALAAAAAAAPSSLQQRRVLSSPAEVNEFSAWIDAISPTSTVLVTPPRDVGGFVWFTLGRPNYLSVDQSAGVVFSRATALEVERRSQILMPLMTPNWMIRTRLRENAAAVASTSATRPLTPESLSSVCRDPSLGFVISPQNVGFDPITHRTDGIWKGWNLYDCRLVRGSSKNLAWDWSL